MIHFRGNAFYPFALDWQEQSNGRHVVPGLGVYFLHPSEGDWSLDEIQRQINFIRNHHLAGEAHYRVKFVTDNTQKLYDILPNDFFPYPSLHPPLTWAYSTDPSAPSELKAEQISEGYTRLRWKASTDNDKQNAPAYVVYASDELPVDTQNPANTVATGIRETEYIYAPSLPWTTRRHFVVTAIDRYGNESEPSAPASRY